MRISFILSSLWLSGGVHVIIEFANRLTSRGHQVTLVVPGCTVDPRMSQVLVPDVQLVQSKMARSNHLSAVQIASLAWSMAVAVPPSDVVVSTHTPTTVSGFLAARLIRRARLAWLFADYCEMFVNRPIEGWLLRNALRWHDQALALSNYSRRELHSYCPGNIIVVGLGLSDPELLRPAPVQPQHDSSRQQTILYLGDTRPRKGMADFLQAANLVHQQIGSIKLVIVSKENAQIESNVPYEYVHSPTRGELARLYATCDLFVSASWREGFGLPPLEAMACGAPVVLTDSGGVREYALSGENCLMVKPHDPMALARAMTQVLSDPQLAIRFRRAGPLTAERFAWSSAVDRVERAFVELVANGLKAPTDLSTRIV